MLNLTSENNPLPVPDVLWFSCDGMMVIDEKRRILAMNPALERMLGCKTEQVVGKTECGVLFSCRNLQGCSMAAQPEQCPGLKAMVDVDGFKMYNDYAGHLAGDDLLKSLSSLFRMGRRAPDFIARYGGDGFVLLLPETDAAGAIVVLERLREAVRRFPFPRLPKPVSISVGVAVFPDDGERLEQLLSAADRRLYEAKRAGCDRVVGPEP